MGVARKSATKAKARERARAAAAARIEREQKIMTASEAFYAKTLARETEREKLREQIQNLTEQLVALDGVVPEAAEEVQAMKDQGLTNKEIAELLELTSAEVSAYLKYQDPGTADSTQGLEASEGDSDGRVD